MDCSWADSQLCTPHAGKSNLPRELLEIISHGSNPQFLDALALAALDPKNTETIFTYYEPIFGDLCGRWLSSLEVEASPLAIVSAFARILPWASHLAVFAEELILNQRAGVFEQISSRTGFHLQDLSDQVLHDLLLAVFRLLLFDNHAFAQAIAPLQLQFLLRHENRCIRYLAVRVLCLYLHAADMAMIKMMAQYLGEEAIIGDWEGRSIDYGFLSLWEEKRMEEMEKQLQLVRQKRAQAIPDAIPRRIIRPDNLTPLTAEVAGVLMPRLNDSPTRTSSLVLTSTTCSNLVCLAKALLKPEPILITGLAGSGKTALILDVAMKLDTATSMITLHLNEQTDAKLLIGMYTMDSTPGSFVWRPGVLTQAVQEGRWVLIEDIDQAPTEVISVLLPLIEHGELLIPNRGERVRAARGFKLIATMRTVINAQGIESLPRLSMLGMRLWKRVPVLLPANNEINLIIGHTFPLLHAYLPTIINVYARIQVLYQQASAIARNQSLLGKPLNPRDVFKWCRRIHHVLTAAGLQTGDEPLSEDLRDSIFMEAIDCFARGLQPGSGQAAVISCIAQELHISPQRVQYCLYARIPKYSNTGLDIRIGRTALRKRKLLREARAHHKRVREEPFAFTNHALRLLEQVAVAVQAEEPILLVGETGTGKTTTVQQLADQLGNKLTVVNLSQQSESGDLLGGFKPVSVRTLALPLKEEFDDLFESTFSRTKNIKYLDTLGRRVAKGQWSRAVILWREALRMVEGAFGPLNEPMDIRSARPADQAKKRRKLDGTIRETLKARWITFASNLEKLSLQMAGGSKSFAFSFIEGNIVKAAKNGDWVLLDEINLASPHTLESIADLLQSGPGSPPSLLLSEAGVAERFSAHPSFRIFGAMNPATDVGKKDLPLGLRSRFTEIYVESPDKDLANLLEVVKAYLGSFSTTDERAANDVSRLYLEAKHLAEDNQLVDGADQRAHFSLRTLTRTLSYVIDISSVYGLRRALFEGFSMSFLTLLSKESERLLLPLIEKYILGNHRNARSLLRQMPRLPNDNIGYVQFKHYWIRKGPLAIEHQPQYIITPFVERNLLNLVRATSTRRFPVLIQGPTSSGKTSMIEYLAKISGNRYVRINNHEHTDLQEYVGTYVSGPEGQLVYQEGILIRALREGHWVVLDELNLAPTDVLEALNRLLDDNRELLIPETQEVVRPHPEFMLFATQNPAGLYGGRKILSRAFRNRFLELHFDDIPDDELEIILRERTQIAPSFCTRIVAVYKKLSLLRQTNRLFEQRNSFATLRDLFRWAQRNADDREQLARNGFMLLAERVRNTEERSAVKAVIEDVMKVKLHEDFLYSPVQVGHLGQPASLPASNAVVWTKAMCRLYTLVSRALENNEPVLFVGETGCGKTTMCQVMAEVLGKKLYAINAHQNTETGDLIGAQRPIRNRAAIEEQLQNDLVVLLAAQPNRVAPVKDDIEFLLQAYDEVVISDSSERSQELRHRVETNRRKCKALFEWSDGSLVHAMRTGQHFLLDEISLADDSVLERLNSVLEPQRSLLLAEKGPDQSIVEASEGFHFMATMNPGGDYGKRELSPALRNRFTEIWVPPSSDAQDVVQLVQAKILPQFRSFSDILVQFAQWFRAEYHPSATSTISIRDVLTWVDFIQVWQAQDPYLVLLHGAAMIYIDTLGANPGALFSIPTNRIQQEREKCLEKLSILLDYNVAPLYRERSHVVIDEHQLSIGSFSIERADGATDDPGFNLRASTTQKNAMRVLRALQLKKPILLEGDPGVGKTTLILSLAQLTGKKLTRINLSEQTDLTDLFGSDVPIEGAEAGHFTWLEAPFLQAMQNGDWVLLDEMNLASQSVLEGLNACFDHRGEIYISELDQRFSRHPNFVVFAAQNPHHQGGGRKGLPTSFVNRFTVVYADLLTSDDMMLICRHSFTDISVTTIQDLIYFVMALKSEISHNRKFAGHGGPWEFNLRDVLRWLQLLSSRDSLIMAGSPSDFLDLLFTHRFRTQEDKDYLKSLFESQLGQRIAEQNYYYNLSPNFLQVGHGYLARNPLIQHTASPNIELSRVQLPIMETLIICIQRNWPCILAGPSGCGKSVLLKQVAAYAGAELVEFAVNSDIDTMDLVGGYEQVDPRQHTSAFLEVLHDYIHNQVLEALVAGQRPFDALLMLDDLLRGKADNVELERVSRFLRDLLESSPTGSMSELTQRCDELLHQPAAVDKARFEWVDGILIEAVERGKWLVLDNANLCSASVLDRLNSLLEPNGALLINEHPTKDGSGYLMKPHPDFRIFLTMDPRYGELSRAMRNRCVEVFVPFREPSPLADTAGTSHSFACESSVARLRYLRALDWTRFSADLSTRLTDVCLEHLSISDMQVLPRVQKQASAGMLSPSPNVQHMSFCSFERYLSLLGSQQWWSRGLLPFYNAIASAVRLGDDFRVAQSIHPLVNPIPVIISTKVRPELDPHWIAAQQEFILEVSRLNQQLACAQYESEKKKPAQLTRLQRSFASTRVQSFSKESTSGVAYFLDKLRQAFWDWIQEQSQLANAQQDIVGSLFDLICYWQDFYDLLQSTTFEEGVFQAYLILGHIMVSRGMDQEGPLSNLFQKVGEGLNHFNASWKLSTGLSMERLWEVCRPQAPPTLAQLSTFLRMEELADRFDDALWRSQVSVMHLSDLRGSIARALGATQLQNAQSEELVHSVTTAITEIEIEYGTETAKHMPYYQDEFEGLCQHYDLLRPSACSKANNGSLLPDPLVYLLAGRPTKLALSSQQGSSISAAFSSLKEYAGNGRSSTSWMAFRGITLINITQKISHAGTVSLGALELLQTEVNVLGSSTALATATLALDQMELLNRQLCKLLSMVLNVHSSYLEESFLGNILYILDSIQQSTHDMRISKTYLDQLEPAQVFKSDLTEEHYFRKIAARFLVPSIASLIKATTNDSTNYRESATAWLYFSIACLLLYVPDRPFDPAIKPIVQRQRHNKRRSELQRKLEAGKHFEQIFTGQSTNLRIRLLEQHLLFLGDEPPIPAIARPSVSDLTQLQGEFNNLLRSVFASSRTGDDIVRLVERDRWVYPEIKILRMNLTQVISRLKKGFREYDDLTAPAVGMLQCLDVGLFLATLEDSQSDATSNKILSLTERIPFMGGTPDTFLQFQIEETSMRRDECISYLDFLGVAQGVDRGTLSSYEQRQQLHYVFHSLYQDWSEQLGADKEKEAARTGLYRYRGAEDVATEVEEEEFYDMFPTYEEKREVMDSAQTELKLDPRSLASTVAQKHAAIFDSKDTGSVALQAILVHSAARIAKLAHKMESESVPIPAEKLMAPTLLFLDQAQANLQVSTKAGPKYNFYKDVNLLEAKKLLSLVYDVKNRFRQLVKTWREHATLHDVLRTCSELLDLPHNEPLAKLLTKAEKLHGLIYEWQVVASRDFSAADVYDGLTRLVIDWRRLELSTWGRLFDMEDEKCEDDARSWWFVAYEVIIAVPLSLTESQDVQKYAKNLLTVLESFFSSTTIGQYAQRLQIMEAFRELLELLAKDIPSLKCIHRSLANFHSYFKRFEKPVEESLRKGRQTLEKEMKEILLLASWKDTNINALRDSAKRSHHKLFKLVRKYRALLGQPADSLIKQGLHTEDGAHVISQTDDHSLSVAPVDLDALRVCKAYFRDWSTRPLRWTNTPSTIENMSRLAGTLYSPVDVVSYLQSFVSHLTESIKSLRDQTPSNLNKDNKQMVNHLKSRKRKLLADTLKEVRQMGFRSNLAMDVLSRQASLSAVLSTIPAQPDLEQNREMTIADYYLHKLLDVMPTARSATQDHSDELAASEITRSIGYLEAMLSRTMKQREILATFAFKTITMDRIVQSIENIWRSQDDDTHGNGKGTLKEMRGLQKTILWLPEIIDLGCRIVRAQNTLSKTDSSLVMKGLYVWQSKFADFIASWGKLPVVPAGLSTLAHTTWQNEVASSLQQLKADLNQWSEEHPLIAFALKQMILWTDGQKPFANGFVNGEHVVPISDLDDRLWNIMDTVLVALQHLHKSTAGMPLSTEDSAWLVKSDASIVSALRSLSPDTIILKLDEVVSQLRLLDSLELPVAKALFRMVLPIVQEYRNIFSNVVNRYAMLHSSTCRFAHVLARSFAQIASQGFCTPAEKSETQESETEKLEDGTGLGEGTGAEDISKDIQSDEDLSELAQQPEGKDDQRELEDEKDAVDMQHDDMNGEMGDVSEKEDDDDGGNESRESSDEMDEEAGGVDDLDPSTVDEKIWDGGGDEAKKDKQGEGSVGEIQEQELASAEENKTDAPPEAEKRETGEIETEGSEEGEQVSREELDKADPHLQEEETLDLPEEMQLDQDNGSETTKDSDDERMEELSDVNESGIEEQRRNDFDEGDDVRTPDENQTDQDEKRDAEDVDEEKPGDVDSIRSADSPVDTDGEEDSDGGDEGLMASRSNEANVDMDNVTLSDTQGLGGNDDTQQAGDEKGPAQNAQDNQGQNGDSVSGPALQATAEEGQSDQIDHRPNVSRSQPEQAQNNWETNAFKKLGEALERWHRQQRQIREAPKTEAQHQSKNQEADATEMEFEHLPDEAALADAQALDGATEDQAQALDESRAIESEGKEAGPDVMPQADEDEHQDIDIGGLSMQAPRDTQPVAESSDDSIAGGKGYTSDRTHEADEHPIQDDEDLEDVDSHLSSVHLRPTTTDAPRSAEEARRLWSHHENATRDLSLSLTEQLRLILAPTLATKMRGDFRTGKRLNIKRIIPYIASQYKRDKIWMRRSVPSKRNYQIMLAVDDSKSMGESGSGQLAFETLALVSKSLSMLEVGEICIVGFGDAVHVAHEFDKPFSSESGTHVFQQFGFQQTKTDVRKLVAESIELFRDARSKSFGAGADLWQLELIISDGVCEDHDTIRRLVRQAQEERIMIVFVIVDALRGSSIMDMSQATFEPDEDGQMKLKMKRYLDGFPFGYYLVVGDVRELPSVLATALRQWFAEVVDAAG